MTWRGHSGREVGSEGDRLMMGGAGGEGLI